MKTSILLWLIIPGALFIGLVAHGVLTDGPDVTVTNDTDRTVTINACGDIASQIPPGDVETLRPGDSATIGSSIHQSSNACFLYFGGGPVPDACLQLPREGSVKISKVIRPYLKDGCDSYGY